MSFLFFAIFLSITIFTIAHSSKKKRVEKRHQILKHVLRTLTFRVAVDVTDPEGRSAIVGDEEMDTLSFVQVKDNGSVEKEMFRSSQIAAARVLEGSRVTAEITRGYEPMSYPSAQEAAEFVERVSEAVFQQPTAGWVAGSRKKNAEIFYRIVTKMYLQERRGIAAPSERDIDQMFAYMRPESGLNSQTRVVLDVYADEGQGLPRSYTVNLGNRTPLVGLQGASATTPLQRAMAWHALMDEVLASSSQADAETPATQASPQVTEDARTTTDAEEACTSAFHIERSPRTDSRMVGDSVGASSNGWASDAKPSAYDDAPKQYRASEPPQELFSARSEAFADESTRASARQTIKSEPPTAASAFEGRSEVESSVPPLEEDPYKALLESIRKPLSEGPERVSKDEAKAKDFEDAWAQQRAKVYGRDEGA